MILAEMWRKKIDAMKERERTRTINGSLCVTNSTAGVRGEKKKVKNTHTRSPGESSVYSLSMVFEEPPAPAARDEFGLDTCVAPARRLKS
jgi:hypothetical protein